MFVPDLTPVAIACLAVGGFLAALLFWKPARATDLILISVALHVAVLGFLAGRSPPSPPQDAGPARLLLQAEPPPPKEPAKPPKPVPEPEPTPPPKEPEAVPQEPPATTKGTIPEPMTPAGDPKTPPTDPTPADAPSGGSPPAGAKPDEFAGPPAPMRRIFDGQGEGGFVVLLIDRSGSTSRHQLLDRIKEHTAAYLRGKGKRPDRVAIGFFNTGVSWMAIRDGKATLADRPEEIQLTDETVERVVAGFAQVDSDGATDPTAALKGALGLEPNTVYLITDNDDSRTNVDFAWATPKGEKPLLKVVEFGPEGDEPGSTPSKQLIADLKLKIDDTARHTYLPVKSSGKE